MSDIWILGLTTGPHDSGAALFRNGELLTAVNEERFSRKKMDGRFPDCCIEHCFKVGGIKASDLHVVAHGWNMLADAQTLEVLTSRLAEEMPDVAQQMQEFLCATNRTDRDILRRLETGLARWGVPRWKLQSYDHHLCHAAAAITQFRNFADCQAEDLVCVTLDGRGDYMSGRIVGGDYSMIAGTTMFDSIGFLWAFVTSVLGFKPFRHEGKVLGLAAAGDSAQTIEIFNAALSLKPSKSIQGHWEFRAQWGLDDGANFILYMVELEQDPQKAKARLEQYHLCRQLRSHRREDVAAGLQTFTENIVVQYLQRNGFVRKNLCVSGGVFSNVLLNMRLRDLPDVEQFFVYPNMGDGGLCVGAGILASRERNLRPLVPSTVRLGPEFLPQIAELPSERTQQIPDKHEFATAVANAIHRGSVVGIFGGHMEFGPRALGCRSLLCTAIDSSINDTLNARLRRSEFMPFAPVTLRTHAATAYCGWKNADEASRFMTICYETTAAFRTQCPAVVHKDGTARPQIVDEDDGMYFLVLSEYHRLSGIPTLINTSFNIHEEPIVCSIADAVKAFQQGACDLLAIFPYIVT